MSVMPDRAFISYRRDDTSGYAGRIYDRLQQRFPGQIFMDVSGIDGGVDFVETIESEVRASSVLVALIGRHWLEGRRLDDPEDFVNREIALALENKIPVVPVLLRGAQMPSAAELPDSLKPLARKNAVEVGESSFDRDMAALILTLEPKLGRHTAANWKLMVAAGAIALLVLVGGSAIILRKVWAPASPTPTPTPMSPTPSPDRPSSPTDSASTPTTLLVFEPIGKWSVITGGAAAGSVQLNLKQDQTYEMTNTEGSFQQVASFIGSKGTWTFNRSDMRLTLLGTGSGYGLGITFTGKDNNSFLGVDNTGVTYRFTAGTAPEEDDRKLAESAFNVRRILRNDLNDATKQAAALKKLQNIVDALQAEKQIAQLLEDHGVSPTTTDGVKILDALTEVRTTLTTLNRRDLVRKVNSVTIEKGVSR
jgi:TIR domain-containing protein